MNRNLKKGEAKLKSAYFLAIHQVPSPLLLFLRGGRFLFCLYSLGLLLCSFFFATDIAKGSFVNFIFNELMLYFIYFFLFVFVFTLFPLFSSFLLTAVEFNKQFVCEQKKKKEKLKQYFKLDTHAHTHTHTLWHSLALLENPVGWRAAACNKTATYSFTTTFVTYFCQKILLTGVFFWYNFFLSSSCFKKNNVQYSHFLLLYERSHHWKLCLEKRNEKQNNFSQ